METSLSLDFREVILLGKFTLIAILGAIARFSSIPFTPFILANFEGVTALHRFTPSKKAII
ncbi:hypothetical protein [Coleofasciculus sp. E1-EBD-02]|uniref:hypothetical protein n=1 Tax=Coleofasciculus sp. E1-EBD-02 TaxID=3068481 RepID=UPI0032F54D1B